MHVVPKVWSIWSGGMESEGVDSVSWIVSGESAWISIVRCLEIYTCGNAAEKSEYLQELASVTFSRDDIVGSPESFLKALLNVAKVHFCLLVEITLPLLKVARPRKRHFKKEKATREKCLPN